MAQTQRSAEWKRHLPVGALLELGATTTLPAAGVQSANNVAGLTATLNDVVTGLHAANLRYVLLYNGSPYFHEVQQGLLGALESQQRRGAVWAIMQPMTRRTSTVGTGLTEEFVDAAVANTREVADPLVQTVVNDLSDHPSLLAYVTSDDVDSGSGAAKAAKNVTLIRSFQALDPHGRPASAMWRNPGHTALGDDCQYIIAYEYACGHHENGTETAEGDFHRATFGTITGTSNPDWVDVIRHRVAGLPAGARHMWCLQAHYTTSGAASTRLRQPTDRELRKQFWVLLGEGATGLFWFTYTDFTVGTPQPMIGARQSSNAVASELSSRLTPRMRNLLLRCTKTADLFTTSGGGTVALPTNYASAYVSTLTHRDGRRFVVVCNNSTSTASVTVSSATLSGHLVSLETGARYKLGTDAISLPALDGTMLEYDPGIGVPETDTDLSKSVETLWSTHWANEAAAEYVAPADVVFHPREVSVPVGGDLQAYVDAAPDDTTFLLADGGSYARVTLVGRSGLHFVVQDGDTATCAGFDIYGSEHAQQYNSVGTDFGFVGKLYSGSDASLTTGGVRSIRAQAQRAFLRRPSRDLIFHGIDFVSDGSLVYYRKYDIGGSWQTDHWYANAAVGMRCVDGVLIQGCTISGYKWGSDNSSAAPTDPQENILGSLGHPGIAWGNAGIRNVVVRDSTFTLATNADNRGIPYTFFVDGGQACAFVNNTISGRQHSGTVLFLTNDDYTADIRVPGWVGEYDKRQAQQNFVVDNVVTPIGTTTLVDYAGAQLLCKGNTVNVGAGTIPIFANVTTKVCRLASTRKVFYTAVGSVFDGNTVTGNVTTFVQHDPDPGFTGLGGGATDPSRSLVGQTTVKNNTVSGTVGNWIATKAGATSAVETPNPTSGNSP